MYQVMTDGEFSRRKRFHHVLNEKGEIQFSSHLIGDVFDWLCEVEHFQFLLETQDAIYKVDISTWKA